jgi:hypothetical protein
LKSLLAREGRAQGGEVLVLFNCSSQTGAEMP